MFKKWSLKQKILIPLNIVLLIIITVAAFVAINQYSASAENDMRLQMENLAGILDLTGQGYMWNMEYDSLQKVSDQLIDDKDIEYVVFKNKSEKEITKYDPKKVGKVYAKSVREIKKSGSGESLGFVEIAYNRDKIDSAIKQVLMQVIGIALFMMIFLTVCFQFILNPIVKRLNELILALNHISDVTLQEATGMKSIAEGVATSATEQSSAVTETSATLDEISHMVQSNLDEVNKSNTDVLESFDKADQSKKAMNEMINTMNNISNSNSNMVEQIKESNSNIGSILKVIQEISNQSRVINDIAFQTKLLSFNASVEAARAGEHGKGFAVVAQEVSNLAEMSAKAANEIASKLANSMKNAQDIVSNSTTKVESLLVEGQKVIVQGVNRASVSEKTVALVVENLEKLKNSISHITTASQEQAQGVSNITSAMNELQRAIADNSNSSSKASNSADDLLVEANKMKTLIEELNQEIRGGSSLSEAQKEAQEALENSQDSTDEAA